MSKFFRRRKFCKFTAEGIKEIDYKDLNTLRQYLTREWQNRSKPCDRHKIEIPAPIDNCSETCAFSCVDSLH